MPMPSKEYIEKFKLKYGDGSIQPKSAVHSMV